MNARSALLCAVLSLWTLAPPVVNAAGGATDALPRCPAAAAAGDRLTPPTPPAGVPVDAALLAWLRQQQDSATGLLATHEGADSNTYCNVLAAMTFTLKGEFDKAQDIFAFYQARFNSEFYSDSEPRGFYQNRNVQTGEPDNVARWMGDNAWLCLGILYYESMTADRTYHPMAEAIVALLESFQQQPAGYIASGWKRVDQDEVFDTTAHTEGNLGAYQALLRFEGDSAVTQGVKDWLDYTDRDWRYGPLDIHTWRVLSLGADYGFCLPEIERTDLADHRLKWTVAYGAQQVTGFYPFAALDANNIWGEGTGGAAVSFYKAGYAALGDFYVAELEKLIFDSPHFPETKTISFLALSDPVHHEWADPTKGHVASVCWYIFAKNKFDPFAGTLMAARPVQNPVLRPQAENYESSAGFVRLDARGRQSEGQGIHVAGDDASGDDSGWVEYKVNVLAAITWASIRVRYADDIAGAPAGDTCTLRVDGQVVGTFNTNEFSSGGWEDYFWTRNFSIGPMAAGIHVLRVETSDGNTYGYTLDCCEISANVPPEIATAAWADPNPVKLPAGTAVHVVAGDPDGEALTYAWSQVSGAGTAGFASPTAADSGVSFSAAGSYVLRVTVTDGKGGSVTSDASVAVNAAVDARADTNGDGVVNALDLQIVIANFGKTVGSPGCDARADANGDGVVNALDLQIVIANFGQTLPPQLGYTTIPPYGDLIGLVQGRAVNADPAQQVVANYIRVGGWWTKPTFAQPTVPLAPDGTWECLTVTGGADQLATQFAAFLIPATYSPPACDGQATLPAELYANALAFVLAHRPAPVTRITFCQRVWQVKQAATPVGPGPNYFSDSPASVWVDAGGALHLKCRWDGEHWQCAEVVCEDSLGLGAYQFQVAAVNAFDPNVVLGLFLWDDDAAENHREIDVEMAHWGNAGGPNLQYVVQPWDTAGNRYQFSLPTNQDLWHSFGWTAAGVAFQTTQPDGTVLQSWSYTGGDTPSHGNEQPRINLWIFDSHPPAADVEVVIKSFAWSAP